jgi:hypothetical protein
MNPGHLATPRGTIFTRDVFSDDSFSDQEIASMPVVSWIAHFSDADPGPKSRLFFDGSEKKSFSVARTRKPHQGAAPAVSMAVLRKGTSLPDSYDVPEENTQYLEGVQCTGFANAPARRPGETVTIDVAVTWTT